MTCGSCGDRIRAHAVLADVVPKGSGTLVTLDLRRARLDDT